MEKNEEKEIKIVIKLKDWKECVRFGERDKKEFPAIYCCKDCNKIIYYGETKNLNDRLKNYKYAKDKNGKPSSTAGLTNITMNPYVEKNGLFYLKKEDIKLIIDGKEINYSEEKSSFYRRLIENALILLDENKKLKNSNSDNRKKNKK